MVHGWRDLEFFRVEDGHDEVAEAGQGNDADDDVFHGDS
jgi:hypothetical protein